MRDIFAVAEDKPIYVTNYSWTQPNSVDNKCAEQLLMMLDCGATLIDIPTDMFCHTPRQVTYDQAAIDKQTELAREVHSRGGEVLFSAHTNAFINAGETLAIAKEQKRRGADICKIVGMADSEAEMRDCFYATLLLSEKFGGKFLHLCNGQYNILHRRIAPTLGNALFLCVMEHDSLSTPAQPLLDDAHNILTLAKL